jgi:anti-sigma factor ChrR (cupin superfamily)
MRSGAPFRGCGQSELVELYAIDALPAEERAGFAGHLESCTKCQRELKSLRPVISALSSWPVAEITPSASLREQLSQRIGQAGLVAKSFAALPELAEEDWEQPAPGIYCRILSSDAQADRVSMLVRLDPGVAYPPHTHAGVEELHLLDGELWIDERKLLPGDYNHAPPGTGDKRVWSETGCTCVLITSPSDRLG